VSHRIVQPLAKALQQVRTDEHAIRGTDLVATARIRHAIALRFDVGHRERVVDRHAHPHVVHGLAGRAHTRQQRSVVILDVDQVPFDVEQAVVALPSFIRDSS
jgi:hypothetical protein